MAQHTFQILHQVDLMLKKIENGYSMVKLGMNNQGMYDLVIYGRAITNVLQQLRRTELDFDDWYRPFREEMDKDEMMKFFYKLRSLMLKEGMSPITAEVGFPPLNIKEIQEHYPKPKNAIKFVLGGRSSGSYYEVKNPDGSIEKQMIDITFEPIIVQRFKDGPKTHLGENIEGESTQQMGERYLKIPSKSCFRGPPEIRSNEIVTYDGFKKKTVNRYNPIMNVPYLRPVIHPLIASVAGFNKGGALFRTS